MIEHFITTYVKLHEARTFLTEISKEQVDVRDPLGYARLVRDTVTSFYYYDVARALLEVDDQVIELTSEEFNRSKTYHIDGRVLSLEDAQQDLSTFNIYMYMQEHGYSHLHIPRVRANPIPFNPERDEVIVSV